MHIIIAENAFYEKHFIIMYQDTACAISEPVVTLFKSAVVFHVPPTYSQAVPADVLRNRAISKKFVSKYLNEHQQRNTAKLKIIAVINSS